MDTDDTKMNIDHETDQSSPDKTLLGLNSLSSRLAFFLKQEFWMIQFKAEAIFMQASQSSGNEALHWP